LGDSHTRGNLGKNDYLIAGKVLKKEEKFRATSRGGINLHMRNGEKKVDGNVRGLSMKETSSYGRRKVLAAEKTREFARAGREKGF